MRRKDFLKSASMLSLGSIFLNPLESIAKEKNKKTKKGKYKNVIFMVSDGMSHGTLTMANLLHKELTQNDSEWIKLYTNNLATKHYMDTSSANALVTDSAAGSSSWGGGKKVNNGCLNYNVKDKTFNKPILQKMKAAGKSIGCVTTVPITHATPAGFCIATEKRDDQSLIAEMYLELEPDVMLGGGAKYFLPSLRKDGKDMVQAFEQKKYSVYQSKAALLQNKNKKIIGIFAEDDLPYSLDMMYDESLSKTIPTLSEMAKIALSTLNENPKGFMLQIEAGKVDWAAHANDIGALLYDQLEFDKTIQVVKEFAAGHPDTLVIVTTDHGNANPGLFYGKESNNNFKKIASFKHTTTWILNKIVRSNTPNEVIQMFEYAFNITITEDEAIHILSYYENLSEGGLYNYKKLPYKYTAEILGKYTSTKFADMDHSGDYVELAIVGKHPHTLPLQIQNTDLHHFIVEQTGI
jgi:alkaline phosphatase